MSLWGGALMGRNPPCAETHAHTLPMLQHPHPVLRPSPHAETRPPPPQLWAETLPGDSETLETIGNDPGH